MVDLFQFMPEGQVSNSMERKAAFKQTLMWFLRLLKNSANKLKEMLIRNHGVHEPCGGETGDMAPSA